MNEELRWHLNPTTGPKRILSLDGGGVRGLITLGMLQRIEDLLKSRCPTPDLFRLCHYFDLIAGTSTGSIIAAGLALGMTVAELDKLYRKLCPKIFNATAVGLLKPVFDFRPLEQTLKEFLGDERLQSDKLKTGLLICAKRIDTGSPWVPSNNPNSMYWDSMDKRYLPNKDYELWKIVRASAAAPLYFEPVEVEINDGSIFEKDVGLFVDGGVAGLNNPSLQAFLTVRLPAYGFDWPVGKHQISMVSLGTGWWRQQYAINEFKALRNWRKAAEALASMISDTSVQTVMAMQAMSDPRKPWPINSEVGIVEGCATGAECLTFQRYDAKIIPETMATVFNMRGDTPAQTRRSNELVSKLRLIGNTDPTIMKNLYALGYDVGRVTRPGLDGIEPEDFPAEFDPPFVTA